MPRPPQQRAKGKGAVSSVVEAACQLRTSLHAADAANTLTDDNAALLPHLSNYLSSYNIFGHSMPTREQLTEITHGLLEADMPNTLLQCLKTIKPSSLIAPSGCSDPNCGDGQCGPPSATPFILATMTQTMTVVAQEGTTAADDFLSALVSAGLASNLFELIDAASTAVRVGPRDPMGIIGADHGLATVLDSLQFLTNWIQYHSQDEFEEGNTHYCITLLTEMEDLGFLPRAIALHETLTKTIVLFRGAIELRSSGTDASICQLVGLYALAGNNFPETGIDALSSSTYSDCISRTIVRCSLKLGAKVPQAALGTILSDSTPSSAPAPLLQPHWASAEQCTSILLQAIMAAQTLVRSFTEDPFDDEDEDEKAQQDAMLARSTSVRRLASLETALTLVAVLKNLVAARQDPDKRKGDACAGCALTMLSLQSGSLLSQIVLLLPREVTIQGGLADDVTSLLVILQLKAMGRAVNLR